MYTYSDEPLKPDRDHLLRVQNELRIALAAVESADVPSKLRGEIDIVCRMINWLDREDKSDES